MSIKANYEQVKDNIVKAAISVGRDPDKVELIAVTKFVPIEQIRRL